MRKKYTPEFKGKVALELARGADTATAICSRLEVHPNQAAQWRQRLVRGAHELFGDRSAERRAAERQRLVDDLYGQIGRLTHEVAWLKKGCEAHPLAVRRGWVDPSDGSLPVSAQCALAGVSRSGWYYEPRGPDARDLDDMDAIDRVFTACPMYGSPRITAQLAREGRPVGHKRVERLMREMGLQALYPRPRTSVGAPLDRRFPYLLRGLAVVRPNQVWGTDFTFVRVGGRWLYLIAYLDWFSRCVVDWELCESATAGAAASVLERALASARPEIHNSDQGCQFTAGEYVSVLAAHGVRVSMDGRGRCFDNIFTERLWRTVKYEEVFVSDYSGDAHARSSLAGYFRFYNDVRLHSSLDYKTPAEIYFGGR